MKLKQTNIFCSPRLRFTSEMLVRSWCCDIQMLLEGQCHYLLSVCSFVAQETSLSELLSHSEHRSARRGHSNICLTLS